MNGPEEGKSFLGASLVTTAPDERTFRSTLTSVGVRAGMYVQELKLGSYLNSFPVKKRDSASPCPERRCLC